MSDDSEKNPFAGIFEEQSRYARYLNYIEHEEFDKVPTRWLEDYVKKNEPFVRVNIERDLSIDGEKTEAMVLFEKILTGVKKEIERRETEPVKF